ncbi:MAG: aldehyde dehydrogenase family protein [bacterium]|jgi:acyl-CoA reductase-like NAD-dependent aldehyde dehydrogenase|nr:aldehyde dehydrogenase [Deltaproteobacteria bacterium]MCP4239614.1 aldehyde dehydrogenase family protein [bacterium]MDP7074711.1 aldehyde dehydrogenase family protein [Myxococcota bacterium]MDP7297967.1 aldehyde dehydrogenase family protein [Myxococcota bacterium]HJO23045.1 aldehyde dehydrogenase family protein [Myxococcota bacterium]
MSPRHFDKILIDGHWREAANGHYPITNPATEEVAGFAAECSAEEVGEASRAARRAFERGPWPRMKGEERASLLCRAAQKFREEIPALLDLTIDETGALEAVAKDLHLALAATRIENNSSLARLSMTTPMEPIDIDLGAAGRGVGGAGEVLREPVGVVACISPFNNPLANCAGKVGPALALGNTVVVKPPPAAPMAVAEFCRVIDSVLPPGVLNFVSGSEADIGQALVASPDVDMVSFTGSSAVGRRIQQACGAQMKRSLMELGGKSANLVFADSDQERALRNSMSPWTFHSGQICTAPTRLLVEQSIYREFTSKLAEAAAALEIGDPRKQGVVVGPLISAAQRASVERHVATGCEEGAVLACGGKRPAQPERGYFFEPTLFVDADNQMKIAREEIFGPVITAIPFRDEEEAIALANASDYGLSGYVWSRDGARARRVARRLHTGAVQINGCPPRPDAPFGGYKQSGVGRDGGLYAIHAYTELKFIGWPSDS